MNVMGDKGQAPQPWHYPMYGGYPNPYQQFTSFETPAAPHFYNYYHGAMPFGPMNGQQSPVNHMMHPPMKPFTPGGQLQAFGQEKNLVIDKEQEDQGHSSKDLPPLPPGPPPATQQPFYRPANPGPSPVRFNMNRAPRPQFNQQAPLFNNSGSSKKKRKKKNKFNQAGQQSQGQQFTPPLPPHQLIQPQPPPLPPGPPPASPQPPQEETKILFEPKAKPHAPTLDTKVDQDNWPKELQSYINRCYAKCQNDMDKDRVSIILKGKIMRATSDDTLWIKDWSKESLPLLESEMDTVTIQPVFKASPSEPFSPKKRLSLLSRLGMRSRTRSRSPHKPRQRTPPRRRRRDRSGSSDSDKDTSLLPLSNKKNKTRNLDHGFAKRGGKGKNKGKGRGHFYAEFGESVDDLPVNSELLEKRAARFSDGSRRVKPAKTTVTITNTALSFSEDNTGDFELEDCHIVGTCQDIEKPYLRLTTAPEATAVRPPDVLRQALARVKERWLHSQDYHYACEQLKSIRQDLTVQGIRDRLAVSVYETHARIALEKGDNAEFNQCQSQLKLLHDEDYAENKREFTAYRILYFIFTKESMDLNTVMTSLSKEDQQDQCINHALDVRSAWALSNYHRLFKLYRTAPRMSSYLMDWFLFRERKLALKTVIKAYRQTLPVQFLTQELAFNSDSLCQEFLSEFGVVYADNERTKIDCKASSVSVASA